MTQIDERVVEMRFDNKQFEEGTKQTLGTLSRLKEALKFSDSGKALDDLGKTAKNISLDGLSTGIDLLSQRFSTLGIVGMRVIENITDGLMGKLHSAVSFVTDAIVSGGVKRAMNIENAHFQLQALLKDETKVQAVMADAMESVDGTAYAYDEAAKAASQFAASGIQAGEDMLGALKGITGVAAMTNSDFESIASIFTTVAGNGRLMGDQLLQLSSRGLNAASTLSDYFKEVRGQSNMTEGAIREMVSKGKISFKDFSDAMTWAFGDSAKRANETFTGALSNMKSALARIGAGFISPLVEQNGELVNLFNALRIKINDVKTSLVFDEQSSAISGLTKNASLLNETISKYVKDGRTGFDLITEAVLGNKKSEEELAEINEKVSESFGKIKEAGVVSSEALKEFEENGFTAAHSISEYINGVLDGSIKATGQLRTSIQELTGGMKVNAYDIRSYAENGKLSFDLFNDAMTATALNMGDKSKLFTESFKSMFAEIKANGTVTKENLEDLGKSGIKSAEVLREYINGVADGSIRASYAIKTVADEMTAEGKLTYGDITRLAEEGKITFDVFQSAMENAFGDSNALTKQFSDSFLDMVKNIVTAINEADMTKPMAVFYNGVEVLKNLAKGIYSVLRPIGGAFREVFFSFDPDRIVSFSEAVALFTSKMKLSEKGSKNLRDGMKGIFSVGKLLLDIFVKLIGVIVPINKPIAEMGGGFLGVVGVIGRLLSSFTDLIRSSELLRRGFNVVSGGFSLAMDTLSGLIKMVKNFASSITGLEGYEKLINAITKAFEKLSSKASSYIEDFINEAENMFKTFFNFEDVNIDDVLNEVSKAFSNLAWEIEHFSLDRVKDGLDSLKMKVKDLWDVAMGNEGFATFVTNFVQYGKDLEDAFTLDNLLDRLKKVMEVFKEFFQWIKISLAPAFSDFSVGGAVAAGGGIGIVYSMIKAAKAFEKISNVMGSIPKVMGSVKDTLVAYQKDLKADALMKTAAAIAILAGALVLLSFADPDRLLTASIALSLIAGVLLAGFTKFLDAVNKGREAEQAMGIFAKGLRSTMKKFGRSLEIKAIGKMIKDFAKGIALIAGSIVAIGLLYQKDKDAFDAALKTVGMIAAALAGMMVLMAIGSRFGSGKSMANIGKSILMISASLGLIVLSLSKLMKMELPDDYEKKLDILGSIIKRLGILAVVLGITARIAGGNQLPNMAKTIKSLAILMGTMVLSLKVLFDMKMPLDYKKKLQILGEVFAAIMMLVVAIGASAFIGGGKEFKAAGTIMSIAALLVVVVGALFVLTLIPADKMLKGALALGAILVALGVALYGAGKVSTPDSAKAVMAMALMVGVITASLAVLGMIPAAKLLKAALALGAILLALAADFAAVGKVSNNSAWISVLAMFAAVLAVSYSLYELAEQPWDSLLSAALALGGVLLAMSGSFLIISKANPNPMGMATYLEAVVGVMAIAFALYKLAEKDWQSLLVAAASLSIVLLSMTAAMGVAALIGTVAPAAVVGMGLLDAFIINFLAILAALGAISKSEAITALLSGGMDMLTQLGQAIGDFIGAIVNGVLTQIASGLPQIGIYLSEFMGNLGGFIEGSKNIKSESLEGVKALAGIIMALSAAEIINGIANLLPFSPSLGNMAVELSDFMEKLEPFIDLSNKLDKDAMEACGYLANMVIKLTAADLLSGIGRFLGIGGNLADFGAELETFGKAMAKFAIVVAPIKPSMVEGAAAAAEIMTTVASKLQGHGGFVQKIFGDKSLKEFAEELVAFGPSILLFGIIVSPVKKEMVEGAAAAAEIMTTVAENLPEQGGLVQKLFGSKSLKEFGIELAAFGPLIVDFSKKVSEIDQVAVAGAAAATNIMSIIANNLPDSNSLWNKIFGGGKVSLSDFGEELVAFGTSMSEFSGSLTDMDPALINEAILAFEKLVALTTDLENASPESLRNFVGSLGTIGAEGFKEFCSAFIESNKEATKAMNEFVKYCLNALKAKNNDFNKQGSDHAMKYLAGISSKYFVANTTGFGLAMWVLRGLQDQIPNFTKKGELSASEYFRGFSNMQSQASSIASTLAGGILDSLNSVNELLYNAGSNAGQGYIDGMKSKVKEAGDVGKEIGDATYNSAKKSLAEKSPSKKMAEVGRFAGLGYINELMLYIVKAHDVGKEIGKETAKGTMTFVSTMADEINNLDLDPVITPYVDLTDLKRSTSEISAMFNDALKMTSLEASSISVMMTPNNVRTKSGKLVGNGVGDTYIEFTQNNTSPKALDAITIYRQTNNQLSMIKNRG